MILILKSWKQLLKYNSNNEKFQHFIVSSLNPLVKTPAQMQPKFMCEFYKNPNGPFPNVQSSNTALATKSSCLEKYQPSEEHLNWLYSLLFVHLWLVTKKDWM